jgi:hypothetical protein
MWSADADGYGRGEGVAAVVMKSLSAAIEDNDPIQCIIRMTGVNQDGKVLLLSSFMLSFAHSLPRAFWRGPRADLAFALQGKPRASPCLTQ